MRPRHVVFHKPLQKLRGCDRAGRPRADIFHISNARLEHFVIGRRQRHTPSAFAFGLRRSDKVLRQFVIIGKYTGHFMAQTDDDRAGQCCQVDHATGRKTFLRVPKNIGQNQTPFSIRVDDFDRVAFHGCDNIAGAHSIARRHILHQPHNADHIGLRPALRQGFHHPRNNARAAHIHSHIFHTARRLQGDAASVKDNPLADQGKWHLVAATVPVHNNDLGGAVRSLAHAQKSAHAKFFQLRFLQHVHLDPQIA